MNDVATSPAPARDMRHCALFDRKIVYDNPHETIIPEIHAGPSVFLADNVSFNQPGWVVRRAEDLRKIYADTENYHKRGNTGFARMIGEDWDIIPTELDPPIHTAYRSALNPIYSPSQMMKLDGKVRGRAQELIARFKDKGECEFVQDFAILFPITIFLEMIDLPVERLEQFLEWENQLLRGTDRDIQVASVRAVKELLMETIAERRKNPGDDLISKCMTLEVDGRKWNDREVFGHAFNLYLGGLDTVTANLSLQFRHLAENPQDQVTMRENTPQQNVVAVEELLRAFAAVSTQRIVTRNTSFMATPCCRAMSCRCPPRSPAAIPKPMQIRRKCASIANRCTSRWGTASTAALASTWPGANCRPRSKSS
ncbi:cytochrome P450 [Novosphingobium lubricantis]